MFTSHAEHWVTHCNMYTRMYLHWSSTRTNLTFLITSLQYPEIVSRNPELSAVGHAGACSSPSGLRHARCPLLGPACIKISTFADRQNIYIEISILTPYWTHGIYKSNHQVVCFSFKGLEHRHITQMKHIASRNSMYKYITVLPLSVWEGRLFPEL